VSELKLPKPVKLVMSLLFSQTGKLEEMLGELAENFGEPDMISEVFPFNYTDYYEREMGTDLKRRMVSFRHLISPDQLPEVKEISTILEYRGGENGRRAVNVDPGYLSLAHFILATGKGYTHRPYLGRGVYADLTLIYRNGDFCTLPWTYPDYGSAEIIGFLRKVRVRYLAQLKGIGK
jgi:hypothetical protein